jgi:1,4-dihydroxy-2-naphthoate octaprenyltransferase
MLALLTTLLLQILSNLANDYGDSKNGIDNESRIGPARTVQSGQISSKQMGWMLVIISLLTIISGSILVFTGTQDIGFGNTLFFLILGLIAIVSAIKYTIGKRPYGYRGYGDLFVFIFFGLTGVGGTFFLHTNHLPWDIFLPASSVGLLSVGVLNINNMRDQVSDKKNGKRTLVVLLGTQKAKIYHIALLAGAIITGLIFSLRHLNTPYQFLFLLTLPMLIQNMLHVMKNTLPQDLDGELKKLALTTLLFSVSFGLGYVM